MTLIAVSLGLLAGLALYALGVAAGIAHAERQRPPRRRRMPPAYSDN